MHAQNATLQVLIQGSIKNRKKKLKSLSFCVKKKLYTVPLKSKALFTRKEGDPAPTVTLARGLQ